MEKKANIASLLLIIALIASYFFFLDKIETLESQLTVTDTVESERAVITDPPILASQLDDINNQLIDVRSELRTTQQKLIVSASKSTVLEDELAQTREKIKAFQPIEQELEDAKKDFALGLHVPKRYDKILDINACHIQPELGNEILDVVKRKTQELKLKPYDVRTHIGFLRHLVIRFGQKTGDIMVNLVTSYENPELIQPLADDILEKFPKVTSIINNVNTKKGDTAYGDFETLLHGSPTITEKIGELTFEISSNSFFQTNSIQAEKLYEAALAGAELTGEEIVYDLYCGTGSISLFLAQQAKEVLSLIHI